jgi:hypothetical protein
MNTLTVTAFTVYSHLIAILHVCHPNFLPSLQAWHKYYLLYICCFPRRVIVCSPPLLRWLSAGKTMKVAKPMAVVKLFLWLPIWLRSDQPHWTPLITHHWLSGCSSFAPFWSPCLYPLNLPCIWLLTQNAKILLFPVCSAFLGSPCFDFSDLWLPLSQPNTMKSSSVTFPYRLTHFTSLCCEELTNISVKYCIFLLLFRRF